MDVKELDFNIVENSVKLDFKIILDMLRDIKDELEDLESRIETLEAAP